MSLLNHVLNDLQQRQPVELSKLNLQEMGIHVIPEAEEVTVHRRDRNLPSFSLAWLSGMLLCGGVFGFMWFKTPELIPFSTRKEWPAVTAPQPAQNQTVVAKLESPAVTAPPSEQNQTVVAQPDHHSPPLPPDDKTKILKDLSPRQENMAVTLPPPPSATNQPKALTAEVAKKQEVPATPPTTPPLDNKESIPSSHEEVVQAKAVPPPSSSRLPDRFDGPTTAPPKQPQLRAEQELGPPLVDYQPPPASTKAPQPKKMWIVESRSTQSDTPAKKKKGEADATPQAKKNQEKLNQPETVVTLEDLAKTGEQLIRAGDETGANQIWQQMQQRAPNHLTTYVVGAKLALLQKRETNAIEWLKKGVAMAPNRNDLLGMLSFLQQKQGELDASEQGYHILVQREKLYAPWWLGWAISLDQLERKKEALSAYQTAYELGGLESAVLNYIQERVQVLMSTPG
ncbi:MAG: hypothetical protein H7839_03515 [Magnetococcus sp. YQC-5]